MKRLVFVLVLVAVAVSSIGSVRAGMTELSNEEMSDVYAQGAPVGDLDDLKNLDNLQQRLDERFGGNRVGRTAMKQGLNRLVRSKMLNQTNRQIDSAQSIIKGASIKKDGLHLRINGNALFDAIFMGGQQNGISLNRLYDRAFTALKHSDEIFSSVESAVKAGEKISAMKRRTNGSNNRGRSSRRGR